MNQESKAKLETTAGVLLKDWQVRLRLQDWDIKISIDNHYAVEGFGSAKILTKYKAAHIQLADPDTIDNDLVINDIEVTLVHELLHVKADESLMDLDVLPKINESNSWECFIDHTAQALVAAKRGEQRVK